MSCELFQRLLEERTAEFNALVELGDDALAGLHLALSVAPLRRIYSYAVPDDRVLGALAYHGCAGEGVLEIGAGTGLWASELRSNGVPTLAYDLAPWTLKASNAHNGYHSVNGQQAPAFTRVAQVDNLEAAVRDAGASAVLFLCWPPPEEKNAEATPEDVIYMAQRVLMSFGGRTVAYIGEMESDSSRTAGPRFHGALRSDWTCVDNIPLQWRFPGCRDALSIWTRNSKAESTWPSPSLLFTTNHGMASEEMETAGAIRARMVDATAASWQAAAAQHIASRRLRGGPAARPGPEANAVSGFLRSAASGPWLRRTMTRLLCA
jgi:hypothetical protein